MCFCILLFYGVNSSVNLNHSICFFNGEIWTIACVILEWLSPILLFQNLYALSFFNTLKIFQKHISTFLCDAKLNLRPFLPVQVCTVNPTYTIFSSNTFCAFVLQLFVLYYRCIMAISEKVAFYLRVLQK